MCSTVGVHQIGTHVPRLLTLLMLLVSAAPSTRSAPLETTGMEGFTRLLAEPVVLDPERPARRRFDTLTFLEGWVLRSADPRFGGLSALGTARDGLLAISDAGTVMHIRFWGGRPAALRLHALPDGPGDPGRKADRDTEALAIDPGTGRHWIAFEQHHQIWRYGPGLARAEAQAPIPHARSWRKNGGVEALAYLPGGRALAVSEGRAGPGGTADLLLFAGDPALAGTPARRLRYRPPGNYRVTDAAPLDGARLLVLHRRFSLADGFGALLGVVDLAALERNAVVTPRVLAEWGPQLAIDNLEGLAVAREGGRTIVWLASDDGFNTVQRTLLLKFAL